MEIQFLGTSAGQPSKSRNTQAIALKLLDERNEIWLFDCGEATQHQILNTTIKPRKITKIFITHMHGDHIFGLPGFLSSRSFQSSDEQTDLEIYGPVGIKNFVLTSLKLSGSKLGYRINFHEISTAGKIFEDDSFEVYTDLLDHTIFCLGYRVVQKNRAGELDAEALKAAGLPFGPLFGKIKKGQTVEYNNQIFDPKDFVGEDKQGKIVTILGDTRKTNSAVRLGWGADLLVHEATYEASESKMARNHGHSTSKQAADVAQEAGVKRLLLTHISARYVGPLVGQLVKEAQLVHENSFVVKDFYEEKID
ncbi:ribonuclease Z [Lactococcus fujiensis]|uniref:Ribonuclease Z n=1 Tax=Lactococcus fujiensis JCM 16395 TaxID=1291764 RepID=A0A2A5RPC1_9LACT|nr:ribonuclease Z [Lactococcus fujiensis]PCS01278.1 ribonuclease Z [Lactococcus fujiensis JCM 16395]